MIAEIHGKISSTGTNLSDRLEDNLTGNFFGTMRYIPFDQGLKPILRNYLYPPTAAALVEKTDAQYWGENIRFWPYHEEGELDALVEFSDLIIGIEVKYLSGLSSDDDVSSEMETDNAVQWKESQNQLARESRIVAANGKNKAKLLLLVADACDCYSIYNNVQNRGILADGVVLGTITWQDIFHGLVELHYDNPYHTLIQRDLIALLKRKGFEWFRDFSFAYVDIEATMHYSFAPQKALAFIQDTTLRIQEDLYYVFG